MKTKPLLVAGIVDDIRRLFHVLTEKSKEVVNETCLTGPQLWAVKILKESSPMKVSDLARQMYLHPPTIVGLLDKLAAKGLINRTRSEKDRRVVFIDLTEQGHEIVNNSPEVIQSLLIKGLEIHSTQKLRTISDGLSQIITILGANETPPQLIMSSEINLPRKKKKLSN